MFSKIRTVVAVDLSNDALTKAVMVSTDGEKYLVEGWDYYSEETSGNADLLQQQKPEAATVVLGDAHTLCFPVPELTTFNIEMEKRKRGLSVETQLSDHVIVSNSSILAAIRRETADEVLKSVRETFPSIPQFTITQGMVAMLYVYLRSYRPQPEIRTALLHCAGPVVSVLVAQTEMPVWEGSIEITPENSENIYSEISALMQEANEKLGASRYDLLLLAGDCDEQDVKAMRAFATQVELLTPFRNGAFELGRAIAPRRKEALRDGHRLAIAIGSAGMLLERIGLNLAETEIELAHEMPLERVVQRESTPLGMMLSGASQGTKKLLPLLIDQSRILIASLIIAAALFSYRWYVSSQEFTHVDIDIAREQNRAATLTDIRTRFDEFNNKIAAINQRVTTIGEIRKSQLTVKTVLDEIDQRVPKGLVFGDLEVTDTNIHIKGYAPERPAVFAFANRLGQSIGVFADVVPTYDDKTNIGNYEITCKYIGNVPVNEMPIPGAPRLAQTTAKE